MTTQTCFYRSGWTDSGDRGADMADHNRTHHADHAHVFGDSPYDWEHAGETYIVPLSGGVRGIRPETVQRCTVQGCSVKASDVRECKP